MRVLFIIDSLGTGGAERSTVDFCFYLKSLNHTVKIICLRRREQGFQHEAISSGLDVNFLSGTNLISNVMEINRICKVYNPEILHTTLFKSRLRGKLHRIFFGKRYLLLESLVTVPFEPSRI